MPFLQPMSMSDTTGCIKTSLLCNNTDTEIALLLLLLKVTFLYIVKLKRSCRKFWRMGSGGNLREEIVHLKRCGQWRSIIQYNTISIYNARMVGRRSEFEARTVARGEMETRGSERRHGRNNMSYYLLIARWRAIVLNTWICLLPWVYTRPLDEHFT